MVNGKVEMEDEIEYMDGHCPKHHEQLRGRDCFQCWGEGGFHDCFDDCCCCSDPEEITTVCDECKGTGYLIWCPKCIEEENEAAKRMMEKER